MKYLTHFETRFTCVFYLTAILQLKTPIDFSAPQRKSICIPDEYIAHKVTSSTKCFFAGWGIVDYYNPAMAYELKHLEAPIVSPSVCKQIFKYKPLGDARFCAGKGSKNEGVCFGDNGGSLACELENGKYFMWSA